MARRFFQRLDKFLTKWELKGVKAADRAHRYAINAILLFIGYNLYTIFKGYNDTMVAIRVDWAVIEAKGKE
jgi:hypothetical protein